MLSLPRPLAGLVLFLALAASVAGSAAQQRSTESLATAFADAPSSTLLTKAARLEVDQIPLGEALRLLEVSSGVPLAYSPILLPLNRTVSCHCEELTVGEALRILLWNTGMEGVVLSDHLVIRPIEQPRFRSPTAVLVGRGIESPPVLRRRVGSITGRVVDGATMAPLGAAQVSIAELQIGALTQNNGQFLITNVPEGSYTVRVNRIGYVEAQAPVTVLTDQAVTLNFSLDSEALALDEVIVTGTPGGTRRRALGNAVTRIQTAEVTERVAVANVQEMLTSRTPGLQFQRVSGNVGSGSNIQIRGTSSFNLSSNPLIYVDGVRVDNSSKAGPMLANAGTTYRDQQGSGESNTLFDFNPEDIESIEIIKGPAAATLYGTEASAGVIQIITKKGQDGSPRFNLSVRQGVNFVPDPAGKIGTAVSCLTAEVPPCTSRDDLFTYNMYEEATRYISEGYFDWPTRNLYSYGPSRTYDLNVTGGTANVRYYLSGNFADETGPLYYNTDVTSSFRANVTALLADNLNLDVSTGFVSGNTRYGEPVGSEIGIWRVTKLSDGRCLIRMGLDSCERRGGFADFRPDDVAKIELTREYERFTGSVALNHTLGDWLSQRAIVGLDRRWDVNERLYPKEETIEPVIGQTRQGALDRETPNTMNLSLEYAVNATAQVTPNLRSTTSLGAQYFERRYESLFTNGRSFPAAISRTINQTPITQMSLGYSYIENKSMGFYVQEEVGYNDRLFLTGALRFDDNSAFGANFEAQVYPKISATWVLSEEPFWRISPINSFRLRSAWGKAGRQPNAFAGLNTYTSYRGVGSRTAIGPDAPGNEDVGPEVSTELELGFDIALFDDRISGEFTYYTQKTEGALLNQPVPISTGFPGSVERNVGRIDNWGWEAQANVRVFNSRSLSLEVGLNADHTMNEVKDLGDLPGTTAIRVGMPYPNYTTRWKVMSAELVEPGEFTNAMCDSGVPLVPEGGLESSQVGRGLGGEIVPCEAITSVQENLLLGPAFYTHTFGIRPNLGLFGDRLQIFATATGHYGRWDGDDIAEWLGFFNITEKAWMMDDPVELAACHQKCRFTDESHDHVTRNDFWKLREIGALYQLPESLVSRIGAERASLGISGRDLSVLWRRAPTINGHAQSDPEHGSAYASNQNDYWHGPPTSSAHLTLRLTF